MKKHELLSRALCEAVELGRPTMIRMGNAALDALMASFDESSFHKIALGLSKFEGVSFRIEPGFAGCVVEHDSCYTAPSFADFTRAIPDTVAIMRDTKAPAVVAW